MSFWSILGGLASALVALFVALIGWRWQLIGKRQTELAEEALLAFARAAEGLRLVRSPITLTGELAASREELKVPLDKRVPGEDFRTALWRLAKQRDSFAELKKVQVLCKYHFGQPAFDAFGELFKARHQIWVAGTMGASAREENWDATPDNRQLMVKWQNTIWQGAADPDEIEIMVSAAEAKLEAQLKPYLLAEAAFMPLSLRWQAGRNWLTDRLFRRAKAD